MLKQIFMVVIVSLFLVLSSAFTGDDATASARARTMALQQTCSCGVDCGSGTCTFDCQGSFGACVRCIGACCVAAAKAEGCAGLLN
jgi:hypothetical protein